MSKTVLITGSSSGFGNDVAKTLAAAGHRVFATMRDIRGRHAGAAADLKTKGIETLELDATDDASAERAFKALFDKTEGRLDVLINNAGIASAGLSETFSTEQVREMFEVNVVGVHRVMRAALPAMKAAHSGLIINLGSILGRLTIPFLGLYGASKHALEAMSDSYRYELSQLGIDVVLVQPGPYPTNLYATMQQPTDSGRAASYGDVATLPGQVGTVLQGFFSGADAPKPHDVAEAMLKLIDTPPGQRPDRVVVGGAYGADVANAALGPLQAQMVSGFGLDHLAKLKVQ